MGISSEEWFKRFAEALLLLDDSTSRVDADWIARAAYPSAQLLTPEDAAARLVGPVSRNQPRDLGKPAARKR